MIKQKKCIAFFFATSSPRPYVSPEENETKWNENISSRFIQERYMAVGTRLSFLFIYLFGFRITEIRIREIVLYFLTLVGTLFFFNLSFGKKYQNSTLKVWVGSSPF